MHTKLQSCNHIDARGLVHIFISEIYFTVVAVTDVFGPCVLGHSISYIAQFFIP